MQILTVLVITMAALLLVSTTVKASPVLPMSEDEPFLQNLSELPAEQDKEFKRGLCGLTRFGCKQSGKRWLALRDKLINGDYPPYRK